MNTQIYVVTHKVVTNKLPKNYDYILVNANGKENPYKYGDNTCDNISVKNPYYCELTACYWIWKNDLENDIVGLAHYRRFLTTNKFSSSIKKYVNNKQIEKDLKKYDFIATKIYHTVETVKTHMELNVSHKDMKSLEDTIKEVCPDYLETYRDVINGHESYLLNMFITKKDNWNKYYEWLFKIFDRLEDKVDMTGYTVQQQRLYGFLSERLFSVYVKKNNYKVKSYSTHIVGESKFRIFRQKILKLIGIKKD